MERRGFTSTGAAAATTLLLLSSSLLNVQSQTSTALFPAIITFGDSTVDVGNNDHLPSEFRANFLPYGRDFKDHRPTGRFCNGKLTIDIIAEMLGLATFPAAYLSQKTSGENLLIGANFASAGSGYSEDTALLYRAIPLSGQLEYYKKYQSKLAQFAGITKATSIITEALHILSTGSGDFVQNYYIQPHLSGLYTPDQFSSILARNLSNFITDLYGLGARKIGVTTLPPLGCLPASIALHGQGRTGCVERLNLDAQAFNDKINATINSLTKKLPYLKMAIFNIYQPLYELATSPSRNGFFEARNGCCGTGTVRTTVLCKPKSNGACTNATAYVYWDGVHPTEAANMVIVDSIIVEGVGLIG